MSSDLLEFGARPQPYSGELLAQFLSQKAIKNLEPLDKLWTFRDEAHWWFLVREGKEKDWLAALKRKFEPVELMQEAIERPGEFPLALFVRLSNQISGGDSVMDLRPHPHQLFQALSPGKISHLLESGKEKFQPLQENWVVIREMF